MTTFNGIRTNATEPRTLEVRALPEGVNVVIQRDEIHPRRNPVRLGLVIPEAEVPAVALAMLEAVGVQPQRHSALTHGTPKHLESIADQFGRYIEQRDRRAEREAREAERLAALEAERVAAEAADLAELEALARVIYTEGSGLPQVFFVPWEGLRREARARWINAAKTARSAVRAADLFKSL